MQSDEAETATPVPTVGERGISNVDPIAYIVVGGLFVILIVLIVITVANRRKARTRGDRP
jgi:hypothetical protein